MFPDSSYTLTFSSPSSSSSVSVGRSSSAQPPTSRSKRLSPENPSDLAPSSPKRLSTSSSKFVDLQTIQGLCETMSAQMTAMSVRMEQMQEEMNRLRTQCVTYHEQEVHFNGKKYVFRRECVNGQPIGHDKLFEQEHDWNYKYEGYRLCYEGQTENHIPNGYGVWYDGVEYPEEGNKPWTEGFIYRGHWKNGLMFGSGAIFLPYKKFFSGQWTEGLDLIYFHGEVDGRDATWLFPLQSVFKTECFESPKPLEGAHGPILVDGEYCGIYEGNWKDGQRSGFGKMDCSLSPQDIITLEGNWEENEPKGNFRVVYSNGDVYEGLYTEYNRRSGFGTLTRQNGEIFQGIWCSGRDKYGGVSNQYLLRFGPNGEDLGVWCCEENSIPTLLNIKAVVELPSGTYDGFWKDGLRHGRGKMTYSNGVVEEGLWEYGNFQKSESQTSSF